MKRRLPRRLLPIAIVLVAVGGVFAVAATVIQILTYKANAERTAPLAGFNSLGDFANLSHYEFVAFHKENWKTLTNAQQVAVKDLITPHVDDFYLSIEDIPDSDIIKKMHTPEETERHEATIARMKADGYRAESIAAMEQIRDQGYDLIGYDRGMELGWARKRGGPFWMICSSNCYMGNTGAAWREDLYVWCLYRWVRIRTLNHVMA